MRSDGFAIACRGRSRTPGRPCRAGGPSSPTGRRSCRPSTGTRATRAARPSKSMQIGAAGLLRAGSSARPSLGLAASCSSLLAASSAPACCFVVGSSSRPVAIVTSSLSGGNGCFTSLRSASAKMPVVPVEREVELDRRDLRRELAVAEVEEVVAVRIPGRVEGVEELVGDPAQLSVRRAPDVDRRGSRSASGSC